MTGRADTPRGRESRLPASLAAAATAVLFLTVPHQFAVGPRWLIPVVIGAVLVPLTLYSRFRDDNEARWLRAVAIALVTVIVAANVTLLTLVIDELLGGPLLARGSVGGTPLLGSGLVVWVQNVLTLAILYWEIDRGGPHVRGRPAEGRADFLFPQMDVTALAPPNWHPTFLDYLYTSFTNAAAFSPTDTMPLTARAKLLMMLQSLVALVIIVLVTARAVNVLR
ncbi:MAG: hypothetical protein HYX33_04175 [Actinobacteria bacterium]|nr:hypothetical protein [Actinomycetota bacterium]